MSGLFEDLAEQRRARSKASARPRVLAAERRQVALEGVCLDDCWRRSIRRGRCGRSSRGWIWRRSTPRSGRARTGPRRAAGNEAKLLVALWLYATVDGVGSARALGTAVS